MCFAAATFYESFPQVDDEDVIRLIGASRRRLAASRKTEPSETIRHNARRLAIRRVLDSALLGRAQLFARSLGLVAPRLLRRKMTNEAFRRVCSGHRPRAIPAAFRGSCTGCVVAFSANDRTKTETKRNGD